MDSNEESASLKPRSGPSTSGAYSAYAERRIISPNSRLLRHANRAKRIQIIRLHPLYYALWFALIAISGSIPAYEWFFIAQPDCWAARYAHIMASVFIATLTTFVSTILGALCVATRRSMSLWRLHFCAAAAVILGTLSIVNFALAIYFISLTTCYFAQITPADRLPPGGSSSDHRVANWFVTLTVKYDLKLVAVLHLLCTLCAFSIAIAFAIIKNNFKYIRYIDHD